MRFSFHAAILFGLFNAAVSLADGFDPIVRPRKGETVQAGSTFTIKWQSLEEYQAGPVNLFLQTNKETDDLDWIQVISTETESDTGEYKWNVNEDIPSGDNYYIKIGRINDVSVVDFSSRFKIRGSKSSSELANSTASITSTGLASITASTMATSTPSTASSTSTSAPTSTSSAAGAVTSRVVSPFALLLTVAIGFVAL